MRRISCRKANLLLELSYDRALSDGEERQLSDHLAGCAACRAYKEDTARLRALLQGSRPVPSVDLAHRVVSALRSGESVRSTDEAPRPAPRETTTMPWYQHPALRVTATAALVLVIGLSLCLTPLFSFNQVKDSPEDLMDGATAGMGTDKADMGTDKAAAENDAFYIQGNGMSSEFPWAYLMSPEEGGISGGDKNPSAPDTEAALPSDTMAVEEETAYLPEEEPGFSMDIEAQPDLNEPSEPDDEPSYGVENEGNIPSEDHFYVLSGEAVDMTLTVSADGDAVWRGHLADGSAVTFTCAADGAYHMSVDGVLVSQGVFCGYKEDHLLLHDRQLSSIALYFYMDGGILQLEVADLWRS